MKVCKFCDQKGCVRRGCPTCNAWVCSKDRWVCIFCPAAVCCHCYWKHTAVKHLGVEVKEPAE